MALSRVVVAALVLIVLIVSIAIFIDFMNRSREGTVELSACKNTFGGTCMQESLCNKDTHRVIATGCKEGNVCCIEK